MLCAVGPLVAAVGHGPAPSAAVLVAVGLLVGAGAVLLSRDRLPVLGLAGLALLTQAVLQAGYAAAAPPCTAGVAPTDELVVNAGVGLLLLVLAQDAQHGLAALGRAALTRLVAVPALVPALPQGRRTTVPVVPLLRRVERATAALGVRGPPVRARAPHAGVVPLAA